jgi:hypothetical protein
MKIMDEVSLAERSRGLANAASHAIVVGSLIHLLGSALAPGATAYYADTAADRST